MGKKLPLLVSNGDSGLAVYKAAQLFHVARGQTESGRRRLVCFITPAGFGDSEQKIAGLGQTNPPRATGIFFRAETDALAAFPSHDFGDMRRDSRRLFRGKRGRPDADRLASVELAEGVGGGPSGRGRPLHASLAAHHLGRSSR